MFKCNSCGMDVIARSNFTRFACPNCGNTQIVRCNTCKTGSNKYVCVECNFVGP